MPLRLEDRTGEQWFKPSRPHSLQLRQVVPKDVVVPSTVRVMTFTALLLDQADDGSLTSSITQVDDEQLPEGDVTVSVEYSSLNYKDGMILQGIGRLVRNFPHIPGVDLAGTVEASTSDRFRPGDRVAVTGWRMGETHWGGYAQRARVPADWLVAIPDVLSTRQAMAIGTAGFTAMQALMALEYRDISVGPDHPLLVTGASGGVGSSAVFWAGRAGHHVVASTGRMGNAQELEELGAGEVINRNNLGDPPQRPLLSERWAGCIDAVGGDTLAHVLAEMRYGASVAACGLVGGSSLSTSVVPFLLRSVNLLGIDSVMCPQPERDAIWQRIASVASEADTLTQLDGWTTEVSLADVIDLGPKILSGDVKGRIVVSTT